jgi:hypothetical protein
VDIAILISDWLNEKKGNESGDGYCENKLYTKFEKSNTQTRNTGTGLMFFLKQETCPDVFIYGRTSPSPQITCRGRHEVKLSGLNSQYCINRGERFFTGYSLFAVE